MTVEQREEQRQSAAVLIFAGKEDSFPRHEAVFKNHVGIGRARHETAFVMFAIAKVMNRDDLLQTIPVARHGKADRVVRVFLAQRAGGQNQHFVRHRGFRNVQLAALHDDAVFQPFLDAHIGAGVGLVGRTQHAVALGVRLGAAANQVFGLKPGQPFLEVLVVVRLARFNLVRLKRNIVHGVGAVDAHAPLNAAADFLAEHAGHVLLAVQVGRVLVNVREAVDLLPGEVGRGGKQIRVLRLGRFVIGGPDDIEAIHLQFIVAIDQLAVKINVPLHFGKAFNIILLCSHGAVLSF